MCSIWQMNKRKFTVVCIAKRNTANNLLNSKIPVPAYTRRRRDSIVLSMFLEAARPSKPMVIPPAPVSFL